MAEVIVDGARVGAYTDTVAQPGAPTIRVLVVRNLVINNVDIVGSNALAIISGGEIRVTGLLTASAKSGTPGPGAFNDGSCKGQTSSTSEYFRPGSGGGGFGSPGREGGGSIMGGAGATGGMQAGNVLLVPLRGGCDGGDDAQLHRGPPGSGGGAVQLFSRTRIVLGTGAIVAANGSGSYGGGGSGGGILIEAPTLEIAGRVVANGGGGGSCISGQDGRLNATSASGGVNDVACHFPHGSGGNGAAGSLEAAVGESISSRLQSFGGSGGGGVGRIRVNTASGGIRGAGIFSPAPSTGTLGSR